MRIDLDDLKAGLNGISMLDALDLREQADLSIDEIFTVFERFEAPGFRVFNDPEAMKAVGAALWLAARLDGDTDQKFRQFMGSIKLFEVEFPEFPEESRPVAVVPLPDPEPAGG